MTCVVCDRSRDRTLWDQVVVGAREYMRAVENLTGHKPARVEIELADDFYVQLFAVAAERGLAVGVLVREGEHVHTVIPPTIAVSGDIFIQRGSRRT